MVSRLIAACMLNGIPKNSRLDTSFASSQKRPKNGDPVVFRKTVVELIDNRISHVEIVHRTTIICDPRFVDPAQTDIRKLCQQTVVPLLEAIVGLTIGISTRSMVSSEETDWSIVK
eukprot:scaffold22615_cov97-Cylindrotheca_fusiformis.AAC.4